RGAARLRLEHSPCDSASDALWTEGLLPQGISHAWTPPRVSVLTEGQRVRPGRAQPNSRGATDVRHSDHRHRHTHLAIFRSYTAFRSCLFLITPFGHLYSCG